MAISGWGVFLIILVLLVIGGGGGYIGYAHYRARKLGLPPPTLKDLNPFSKNRGGGDNANYRAPAPAPGGIKDWVVDKFNTLRNGRTAGGAYEGTSYGGGARGDYSSSGRRGFGPLDPDEAWDARVDNEAGGYYEEQELGLQDPSHGPYGGGGYGDVGLSGGDDPRGRSRSRSRDGRLNPFGEQAEASSLRSVSPRPDVEPSQPQAPSHTRNTSNLSAEESQNERRSMFREDV